MGGGGGSDPLLVETPQGPVQGTVIGETRAFLAIPYAAPPVGALRFKPPQAHEGWSEPLDATEVGPLCPQLGMLDGQPADGTSEDCLTVNVWTPDPAPAEPRPVMVWIHGGAFEVGSGHGLGTHTGEHIVPTTGSVLVTFNYRLAALGFLAHPDLTSEDSAYPSSGNYGFEDQRFALEWVKANIAAFGGDPDNVLLFGESAGGVSTCLHLVAPDSAGLFQRAAIQSGPCELSTPLAQAELQGEALATATGCDGQADVPACLRGLSPAELLTALPNDPGLFFGDQASWGPVIDGLRLLEPSAITLDSGNFNQVPVLLGSNADEGTLFVWLGGLSGIDEATYDTLVGESAPALGTDAATLLAQYPAANYDTPGAALSALLGHAGFNCATRRTARRLVAAGVDTYLYHFTHAPNLTVIQGLGAFHAADVGLVFGSDHLNLLPISAEEQPLSVAMMGYWSRLGSSGDPNGVDSPPWPAYDSTSDQHLQLDVGAIEAGSKLLEAECDFWDGLQGG